MLRNSLQRMGNLQGALVYRLVTWVNGKGSGRGPDPRQTMLHDKQGMGIVTSIEAA